MYQQLPHNCANCKCPFVMIELISKGFSSCEAEEKGTNRPDVDYPVNVGQDGPEFGLQIMRENRGRPEHRSFNFSGCRFSPFYLFTRTPFPVFISTFFHRYNSSYINLIMFAIVKYLG